MHRLATIVLVSGFGGLEVACWPLVGFAPGRSRRIFRAKKSSALLRSEGKQSRRSHAVALRYVKDP